MTDKVKDYTGSPWTIEAIELLKKLWMEGMSPEMISQTLSKPESVIRAKAAELKLPLHA